MQSYSPEKIESKQDRLNSAELAIVNKPNNRKSALRMAGEAVVIIATVLTVTSLIVFGIVHGVASYSDSQISDIDERSMLLSDASGESIFSSSGPSLY